MDKVGDFITRIRNGGDRRKLSIIALNSQYICSILDCLYNEGYIRGYKINGYFVEVLLKYKDDEPVIKSLVRVSKPSKRVYLNHILIQKTFIKNELLVLSTNKGVFTNKELVIRNYKIGGEVLFRIV